MRDIPSITRFTDSVKEKKPPSQAGAHQSTPAGTMTIESGTVVAVNNTGSTVDNLLAFTCSVTIKGSTQLGVPWIGSDVPTAGTQVKLLVQPPVTYILGKLSTM